MRACLVYCVWVTFAARAAIFTQGTVPAGGFLPRRHRDTTGTIHPPRAGRYLKLVLFRLISLACLLEGGQGPRRAARGKRARAPRPAPPARRGNVHRRRATRVVFRTPCRTACYQCGRMSCARLWGVVSCGVSILRPPASRPLPSVSRSLVSKDSARLLDYLLSIPLDPQLSAAHQRPAITDQIWLRKAVTFHSDHEPNLASEGRYVPRCGAGLGRPDWGQIGARLGLARFGFGRPPRQQAWVAAQ